jgi:segregation and condensation protein A
MANAVKANEKSVGQDQIYDLLVSRELGWQAIIYDLIKTEQLDPWDIDLVLLSRKYIERVQQLEQLGEGAFFISSKVLLAAAILLRIKSEILHENILSIDELLFSKKKSKDGLVNPSTIIDLANESEDYEILPRTPLPRGRKVTLHELMNALDKAMKTEQRRIKKKIFSKQARYQLDLLLPRTTVNIRDKIKSIYLKIKAFFLGKPTEKLTYTELAGSERAERIACFLPVLHLDSQSRIVLEQSEPFAEIDILLKKDFGESKNQAEQ